MILTLISLNCYLSFVEHIWNQNDNTIKKQSMSLIADEGSLIVREYPHGKDNRNTECRPHQEE